MYCFETSTDLVAFPSDINIIDAWFSINHLTANASEMKVMVISTKSDLFPDLFSPSLLMVCKSILCILPNFWVCGLQISCTGNLILTLYLRKVVKSLAFMGRSKSAPFSLRRTLYPAVVGHILQYGSATFHPLISPWPNGLRPLSAPHVVWSADHGIVPMKISYRIPTSHPQQRRDVTSLCHLHKIFSNLLRLHPKPDLRNVCGVHSIPSADINPAVLLSILLLTLEPVSWGHCQCHFPVVIQISCPGPPPLAFHLHFFFLVGILADFVYFSFLDILLVLTFYDIPLFIVRQYWVVPVNFVPNVTI